jgi:hypothetical protein
VFSIGLAAMIIALLPGSADAAEIVIHHHHYHWRFIGGPQLCWLTPVEVVQLDALGPYCSSPRGRYPPLVHTQFYYRPWGRFHGARPGAWFGHPWGW